jgi:hypothetical protein
MAPRSFDEFQMRRAFGMRGDAYGRRGTVGVPGGVVARVLEAFMKGPIFVESPQERSARRRKTASAPASDQRAPVRSIRSLTRCRHAPSTTPVAMGNPL